MEVVGELPDGAEVSLLGAIAQAGQLKDLEHPLAECCRLAKCGRHPYVLSRRSEETALHRTWCHGVATGQGLADLRESPCRGMVVSTG
jgi:hypothetical protein